mgnify:CR=1 FL=1
MIVLWNWPLAHNLFKCKCILIYVQHLCNIPHFTFWYILCWIVMISISLWNYIRITLSDRLSVQIRVWSITFFCFNIVLPYLMTRVTYLSGYDIDLWPQGQIYKVFDKSSCPTHNFCLLWHQHTIMSTWVYQHERICRVYSCVDLWPQGQIYWVFNIALCLGHISGTWMHHHKIMCHIHSWPLYDLDLWPQYQHYICFWRRSFLDWCRHTKFSKRVFHHETTCVQSYQVYDFDLWPTCTFRWRGYP